MEERFYGLIPGRHELPNVSGYVFPETVDPMDFAVMDHEVSDFLKREIGIHTGYDVPVNGLEDAHVFKGNAYLNVYVTGLTPCTAALISGCAINGVSLTLWHFNRETGEYEPQIMF